MPELLAGHTIMPLRQAKDGMTVWDDGEGVSAELVPELFEPFTRGRKSRQVEGSGLGLAIVRALSEAMGGTIVYEPRQPRGASFALRLRRAN